MQDEIFGVYRQPAVDTRRRQLVRSVINQALYSILSKKNSWSFLYRKQTINSEAEESTYALFADFSKLIAVRYDGIKCEVFDPKNIDRYTTSSGSRLSCTIRQLTSSPRNNAGFVFPQTNSKIIDGYGTAFTPSMVGSFFRAGRDGELYRIESFNSATRITLSQKYMGRSQAGSVSIFATSDKTIHGNPHVTNFNQNMKDLLIRIGGTDYTIDSVNTDRQELTVSSSVSPVGSMLPYSIQDTFQIDPKGQYILEFIPNTPDDDKEVEVEYEAFPVPMTGDEDVPVIPERFHHVIVAKAVLIYGALDGLELLDREMFKELYNEGVQGLCNTEDPLDMAFDYSSEPDIVRVQRTDIVR